MGVGGVVVLSSPIGTVAPVATGKASPSKTDWLTAYTILLVVSTVGNTGSKYLVCPIEIDEQINVKTNRKLKVIFFIRLFL
jgi:hypothetical protein